MNTAWYSSDKVQIHHDPDQDKALHEDECMNAWNLE